MMIVSNKILNKHYNVQFDSDKFSVVFVLYRNITCDSLNYAIIGADVRRKLHSTYNNLQKNNIIDSQIYVIGRKYRDKHSKLYVSTNSLSQLPVCKSASSYKMRKRTKAKTQEQKSLVDSVCDYMKHKYQLNDLNHVSVHNIIHNGIYFDIEYINDIRDAFGSFPNSVDESMIFMIGVYHKNNYTNFTVSEMVRPCEQMIMEQFVKYIVNFVKEYGTAVIFHWSPADRVYIEKHLVRYPDLYAEYSTVQNKVFYIDLIPVFKEIIPLASYSLKYVVQKLLNKRYTSNCQNGFKAMMSMIESGDFKKNVDDIIHYNMIDTCILAELVCSYL
jgi:hypothetical protein